MLLVQIQETLFPRGLLENGFFNFCGRACHHDDDVGDENCESGSGGQPQLLEWFIGTQIRCFEVRGRSRGARKRDLGGGWFLSHTCIKGHIWVTYGDRICICICIYN